MIQSNEILLNDDLLVEDSTKWWSTWRRLHSICSAEDLCRLVWLLFSHKAVRRSLCTISCEILFVCLLSVSLCRERESGSSSSPGRQIICHRHLHYCQTPWRAHAVIDYTDTISHWVSVESLRSVLITIRNHNFRYLSSNTFIAT